MNTERKVQELIDNYPQYIVHKDDFIYLEKIGQGGFGEVYHAKLKSDPNRECAVKIIFAERLEGHRLKRYIYEVETMATCKNPFLVPLVGFTPEPPYCIVTEFMPNGSLDKYIRHSKRQLSPSQFTIIAMGIAYGMVQLHASNIIHRDLKSANILLDQNFYPRICDFGIARFEDDEGMTKRIGTPNYMAPELIISNTYTFKVDIYAYGMILYEIAERIRPFHGLKMQDIFTRVVNRHERPAFTSKTPEAMKKLIVKCWDQEPEERPDFDMIYRQFKFTKVCFPDTKQREIYKFLHYIEINTLHSREENSPNPLNYSSPNQEFLQNLSTFNNHSRKKNVDINTDGELNQISRGNQKQHYNRNVYCNLDCKQCHSEESGGGV